MGVKLRLVQYPCRSGWPSGVRGKTHVFFAAVLVAAFPAAPEVVWAATHAGTDKTAAITSKAFAETLKRLPISPSLTASTCPGPCNRGRIASSRQIPHNRNPQVGYSFPCADKVESSPSTGV